MRLAQIPLFVDAPCTSRFRFAEVATVLHELLVRIQRVDAAFRQTTKFREFFGMPREFDWA